LKLGDFEWQNVSLLKIRDVLKSQRGWSGIKDPFEGPLWTKDAQNNINRNDALIYILSIKNINCT